MGERGRHWEHERSWRDIGGVKNTASKGERNTVSVGVGKNEDGWQLVQRKRHRTTRYQGRMDIASVKNGNSNDTVSFYFSDFPETHGAKDMLKAFGLYGKAVEVVVPPKRNKWGKRFGFVRYTDVDDPRLFVVKLDNIIFGADKIHVNIPRFERERHDAKVKNAATVGLRKDERYDAEVKNATIGGLRKVWRVVAKKGSREGKVEEDFPVLTKENKGGNNEYSRKKETKSNFKKSLNRGSRNARKQQNEQKVVYYRKKSICDVWYNATEEELDSFKKMYVGVVKKCRQCSYGPGMV